MLGCQAIALPTTEQIVPSVVSAVLTLDSWNYCSGGQDLTAKHLPLITCVRGFIEEEEVEFSVSCYLGAG